MVRDHGHGHGDGGPRSSPGPEEGVYILLTILGGRRWLPPISRDAQGERFRHDSTHAPPRPPWAAVAALLALGSPHDPALDYTYLTLRMTLRYAALRYATLLLVAGCSSSPAAAARRSRPPRLRPSSSPASCACCLASRCPFTSRRLLRFCVFFLPQPAPPAAAPPAHIPSNSVTAHARDSAPPTFFSGGMAPPTVVGEVYLPS